MRAISQLLKSSEMSFFRKARSYYYNTKKQNAVQAWDVINGSNFKLCDHTGERIDNKDAFVRIVATQHKLNLRPSFFNLIKGYLSKLSNIGISLFEINNDQKTNLPINEQKDYLFIDNEINKAAKAAIKDNISINRVSGVDIAAKMKISRLSDKGIDRLLQLVGSKKQYEFQNFISSIDSIQLLENAQYLMKSYFISREHDPNIRFNNEIRDFIDKNITSSLDKERLEKIETYFVYPNRNFEHLMYEMVERRIEKLKQKGYETSEKG